MAGLRAAISCIFIAILILATGGDFSAESLEMSGTTTKLPKQLGRWTLVGSPRRIDSETIFDYMNGAGELYLAYHFHHLTVAEYGDTDDNRILVEVYKMKGPNDAFGLLSMDWGGEPVVLHEPPAPAPRCPCGGEVE